MEIGVRIQVSGVRNLQAADSSRLNEVPSSTFKVF
jgi:hypothetical protein